MRAVFFLLLAVNAGFAGWWYWSSQRETPNAPLANMQLNADKVRVIPPPVIPLVPAQVAAIKKVSACLEWGVFAPDEVSAAQAGIGRLALAERATRREVQVSANFWVHIPPQKNRAEMNQRVAEIRKKGVTGFQAISEAGAARFAISLGAYPSEQTARQRLEALHSQGVSQALIGTREGNVSRSAFLVRDPSEQVSSKLLSLRSEFPATEIKTVECPPEAPVAQVIDAPARPLASPPR